jgi:hypothetical protein
MLRTDPPPVPWLVESLLARGALTLVAGREGEGKSLTAMQLAVGVAAGVPVVGVGCHRGGVLVIDAENGGQEIHRRVRSLGLAHDAAEYFSIYEAHGWHLESDLRDLEAMLREQAPALVVLDSFRSLWPGGDENDSGEVAQVLDPLRNLLRAHGASGLLLHHSSKRGSYRGSTGIGASCDLVFALESADGDTDPQRRRLACRKCRLAARPAARWLRITSHEGRVSVLPTMPHVRDVAPRTPARDALRPRMLEEIRKRPGLRLSEWAVNAGREPKDGTVRAVRDALEQDGVVERDSTGRYYPVDNEDAPEQCEPREKVQLHPAPTAVGSVRA